MTELSSPVQAAINGTHHYGLSAFPTSTLLSLRAWGLHQYGDFSFDHGAFEMMSLAWPAVFSLVVGYVTMVFVLQPSKATTTASNNTKWRPLMSQQHLAAIRQVWNALLALYSILGATHMLLYLLRQLSTHGLYAVLCHPDPSYYQGPIGFWYLLFCLGKVVELGDTLLLIASGRPVMFLHWFHHATVLPCTWYGVYAQIPTFRVVTTINYTVHAVMYSYFCCWNNTSSNTASADSRRRMREWGQRITMMQCTQFVLDLTAIGVGLYDKVVYDNPDISYIAVALSWSVIGSYLVLFLQFADDKYGWDSQVRHALWVWRNHSNALDNDNDPNQSSSSSRAAMLPWHRSDLTLEQRFHEATKRAALLSDLATPSDLLSLYACYKQVQNGPIPETLLNNAEPMDQRAQAKRQAWSAIHNLTPDDARHKYMELMDTLHDRSSQQAANQRYRRPLLDNIHNSSNSNGDPFVLYPIQIVGHGTCLPHRVVTNREIEERGGFSSQETKRTGVHERRFCDVDGGENLVQNGAQAIRNACAVAGVALEDLDMIVGGFGGHQFLPDDACLVQRELGLGTSGTRSFTVHATCLSFVVALEVAGSLMRDRNGRYRTVAVFASSIASVGIYPQDAHTALLFGDGAAAVILQPSPEDSGAAVHAVQMETYGEGANACRIQGGGTYRHHDHHEHTHRMGYFEMDGPQTLALASKYARIGVRNFLPGLEKGLQNLQFPSHGPMFDIDWVVPHQASAVGLDSLSLYGWPEPKILKTIHKYGNTIAASIPLTLCDGIDTGKIKRGDKVLLCGTSAGLSVGFMLITY